MKLQTTRFMKLLALVLFSAYCHTSQAIPKAAEDENAPVTTGADVAKPSPAKKQTKPSTTEKSKKATPKKAIKPGKTTQKTKTPRSKK